VNGEGSFSCSCNQGFEGDGLSCEVVSSFPSPVPPGVGGSNGTVLGGEKWAVYDDVVASLFLIACKRKFSVEIRANASAPTTGLAGALREETSDDSLEGRLSRLGESQKVTVEELKKWCLQTEMDEGVVCKRKCWPEKTKAEDFLTEEVGVHFSCRERCRQIWSTWERDCEAKTGELQTLFASQRAEVRARWKCMERLCPDSAPLTALPLSGNAGLPKHCAVDKAKKEGLEACVGTAAEMPRELAASWCGEIWSLLSRNREVEKPDEWQWASDAPVTS